MPVKERGVLLTVWLALMLAANIITVILYAVSTFTPIGRLFISSIASWAVYVFMLLAAWNLVCVCFLFLWKKWAFFGICANAAVGLAVNLLVGVGAFAFVGLSGVVFLYLVLRPKWSLFES